eukprot:SAG11_NODE_26859_length_339_cov_140.216667_1_plen_83_part_00
MNILDLNDDIMSKIKHNLFLKSLMKHKGDNFNYDDFDWDNWELVNEYDYFSIENGDWAVTTLAESDEDKYDFECFVFAFKTT